MLRDKTSKPSIHSCEAHLSSSTKRPFKYSHRSTSTLWCLSVWDIDTNLRTKNGQDGSENCNAGSFSRLKRESLSFDAQLERLEPGCELEDQTPSQQECSYLTHRDKEKTNLPPQINQNSVLCKRKDKGFFRNSPPLSALFQDQVSDFTISPHLFSDSSLHTSSCFQSSIILPPAANHGQSRSFDVV